MGMSKGEQTKLKIITATAELLEEKGYSSTGINQILKLSGAPRGSLYFHFPNGKDEIATTAVYAIAQHVQQQMEAELKAGTDLKDSITKVIGVFRDRLVAENFRKGCPIAAVAMELSGTDSPVIEACAVAYHTWKQTISSFLEQYLPQEKAMDLAELTFSLIEGALLVARATRDLRPIQVAEQHCLTLLEQASQ